MEPHPKKSKSKLTQKQVTAIRISAIYFLIAGLWIFFSDKVLDMAVDPKHQLTQLQTFKGIFFILITSIFIYFLVIRNSVNEINESTSKVKPVQNKFISDKNFISLAIVFLFFSAAVVFFGYLYYLSQKNSAINSFHSELNAIADLKSAQIENWRKERLGIATALQSNDHIFSFVKQESEAPSDLREINKLRNWFRTLIRVYDYKNIYVIDEQNNIILSAGDSLRIFSEYELKTVEEARVQQKIVISDFAADNTNLKSYSLNLVIPLTGGGFSSAAIILNTDPTEFLYPLMSFWPLESKTGETVLVRREGDSVLYLSELRFRQNSALTYKIPLSDDTKASVIAVNGVTGINESFDYRGEKVLSYIKPVEGTPWILIAKIDLKEIYSPIWERSFYVGAIFIVLVAVLGLSTGLYFRRERESYYRHLYETEVQRKFLFEKYNYLNKYANDIIIIADKNLNIVEANDRAIETYGYTMQEFLEMNLVELRTPEERSKFNENLSKLEKEGSIVVETRHLRKDSSSFFVEASIRAIIIDSEIFYQSIVRDITERKQKNEQLQKSLKEKEVMLREIHHRVKNNLQVISSMLKLQSQYINDPHITDFFLISQNRVKSMALVHQSLYKSRDLSSISFNEYVIQLVNFLMQSYGKNNNNIEIRVKSDDVNMETDTAIPCGLLVNELVSNALKHAFNDKEEGYIEIKMERDQNGIYLLSVKDNGLGIPDHIDIKDTQTLGMQLVMSLVEQLDGEIELIKDEGSEFRIKFPPLDYQIRM